VFCLSLFISCFGGCGQPSGVDGTVSVLSWNVQALYDGTDDGWEYDDYRGMTQEKFGARLTAISEALAAAGDANPAVIAFIELENREILEKLSGEYLGRAGYNYCFFARAGGNSLGIGVLSRFPFVRSLAHSVNADGSVIPRPVAEVAFRAGAEGAEEEITLFVCHWKSKLGGDEKTEALRREAAKVIVRRHREILAVNPGAAVAVLGDLNENFDEFHRQAGGFVCALMPDDPLAARLAGFAAPEAQAEDEDGAGDEDGAAGGTEAARPVQDFLIISAEKPPLALFYKDCDNVFYSPWHNEMEKGSYFYGGEWETIDHFLLNPSFFDKRGWEFDGACVLDTEPFVNAKGEPAAYNVRTGKGLSDHLPILLKLRIIGYDP